MKLKRAFVGASLLAIAIIASISMYEMRLIPDAKTDVYRFKELDVQMTLAEGWTVKATTSQQGSANFYNWIIQKPGADGEINVSSTGYRGYSQSCRGAGSLTPIQVTEVASTLSSRFMYMSWVYKQSTQVFFSGIVKSDEAILRTINDADIPGIRNAVISAGSYYYCATESTPGMNLQLNDSPAPGFARRDQIRALQKVGAASDGITSKAQSYYDIKAMLRSIK